MNYYFLMIDWQFWGFHGSLANLKKQNHSYIMVYSCFFSGFVKCLLSTRFLMCSIVLGSNGANKSYQWMIKSSSEHAWYGQKHSISLYFLLQQCQAVPGIIKKRCMKELIKYYTPLPSGNIFDREKQSHEQEKGCSSISGS